MRCFNDEHGDLFSRISFVTFYECFPVFFQVCKMVYFLVVPFCFGSSPNMLDIAL